MRSLFLLFIAGTFSISVTAQVPPPATKSPTPLSKQFQQRWQQPLSQQFTQQLTKSPSSDRELVQVWDTIYNWNWNVDLHQWEVESRSVDLQYNGNFEWVGGVGQTWNGSTWENASMFSETVSDDGFTTISTGYTWSGSAWVNVRRSIIVWDPANNTKTWTSQDWMNGDWLNKYQFILLINEDGLMISETDLYWLNGGWVNGSKYLYFYDDDNYLTMWKIQDWMNGTWEDMARYTLTYYPNNNLSSQLEQYFMDNTWVNSSKDTLFTYDNQNNMTGITTMWWIDTEWVNAYKSESAYDVYNNPVSSMGWQWWNDNWELSTKQNWKYSYDENGFIAGKSRKEYFDMGTEPVFGDSSFYIYHTVITSNGQVPLAEVGIAVWPNPGKDVFNISSNEVIRQMEIYDINGHLLRTIAAAGQSSRKINLSDAPKGIYILRLQTDSGIHQRKVIIH